MRSYGPPSASLIANIMMLAKMRAGAYIAWLKVIAVLGSCGVAAWQVTYLVEQFPEGSPERMGAYFGAGFVLLIRLGLTVLYGIAVVYFLNWVEQRDRAQKSHW